MGNFQFVSGVFHMSVLIFFSYIIGLIMKEWKNVKQLVIFQLYKQMTDEQMYHKIIHRHIRRQKDINRALGKILSCRRRINKKHQYGK